MMLSHKSLECQFAIIHHASLLLPFERAWNGIRYSDGKTAVRLAVQVIFSCQDLVFPVFTVWSKPYVTSSSFSFALEAGAPPL